MVIFSKLYMLRYLFVTELFCNNRHIPTDTIIVYKIQIVYPKLHLNSSICMILYTVIPLTRPLYQGSPCFVRPYFRCTVIVKYYLNVPLKRGHSSSYTATFHYRRTGFLREALLYCVYLLAYCV